MELLQNAADAATEAGVPGRVLIRLVDDVLLVANTGTALTVQGLQALSTLRASAKRGLEGSVGRFGTGFSAVLSVTDSPAIVSDGTAIGWSRAATAQAVGEIPALAEEVALRGGQLPILRLPFAVSAPAPPPGYDTEVRLPLRAGTDVEPLLRDFDPSILLLLQGISAVTIETPRVRRDHLLRRGTSTVTLDGLTWRVAHASAPVSPELAALGGAERVGLERLSATALLPEGGWPGSIPAVLHAPTPTDEPISLPVLVAADVPLEAHRRRTVPGPLRRAALAVAADAVVALARQLAGPEVLRLVPVGLPAGGVDAELAELLLERFLAAPPAPGRHTLDLGRATAAVHDLLTDPVDPVVTDLLPPSWPVRGDALRALGISPLETADVVALLDDAGRGWLLCQYL